MPSVPGRGIRRVKDISPWLTPLRDRPAHRFLVLAGVVGFVVAAGRQRELETTVGLAYPLQMITFSECRDFRPDGACSEADADNATLMASVSHAS
jgi:hypothetical protein